MESVTGNKKLIVAWICHFTNAEIQDRLKTRKRIAEFAPWITLGIKEIKKRPTEIELHIISPHRWISGIKEFQDGNVFYHFFNPGIPFYGRHWPHFFRWDFFTDFRRNRSRIKKLAEMVRPDIIHFHGAENDYFTSSFFDLYNKFPYLLTIQGFISMAVNGTYFTDKTGYALKKRIENEIRILKTAKYFGVRDDTMKTEILRYNPDAKFYCHEYFINIPDIHDGANTIEKKAYDIIFFTRLTKSKGIEDLIVALGILKNKFPGIKAAILGSADSSYLALLKQLAISHNCLENLDFLGYAPTQEDIYKVLDRSKITVLPVYVGDVAGGIIESMARRVPVVSYKTGSIPAVNENGHHIELAEQGNIEELAGKIEFLLNNPAYAAELADRAFHYALNRWDKGKALDDILAAYYQILTDLKREIYDTNKRN
jgi:glycosyltransferase involved in cell wall biosynthesis